MRKPAATLEWTIAKDDGEWGQLALAPTQLRQKQRCLSKLYGEARLLILLIGGVGGWRWYTTQAEWQRAKTELTVVMQQEVTTPLTVRVLELRGDQALVSATTNAAPTDGQTCFYRHTATGWQRMAPDVENWRTPQQLETASFHWFYRQQDAQVVVTAAPQLEVFYAALRHNFGLANAPIGEKLTIEVSVNQRPGTALLASVWGASDRLIVPSPMFYRASVELTDTDLLLQSLALPLLNSIIAQASERSHLDSSWRPLLRGLRLWQIWDLDLPLANWRKPVVQWLYGDLPGADAAQWVVLPKRYMELCAAHTLWMTSPMQIDIPLLCTALDKETWYTAAWGSHSPLTHLNQLDTPVVRGASTLELPATDHQGPRGQSIALATLIEYAVATFGRERLPTLMVGLGQYQSWETLLPAVYGVSAAEFEAGWQNYLATHYALY